MIPVVKHLVAAFARVPPAKAVIAIGIVVVLLVAGAVILRPTPVPLPDREAHSRDSLDITTPHYDTVRLERLRTETLYVARSARASQHALEAVRVADSLRAIATTLAAAAAAQGDTSATWHRIADVRALENDSLRAATTLLTLALDDQTTALRAADDRARAAELRLAAATDLSQRLAADVRRGDGCRVMVVLSCPSRRVSFAIGLTGGAIAAIAWHRR